MLLSKFAFVKIAPVNIKYWSNLGYQTNKTGGRGGINTGQKIRVRVDDLLPGSNVSVSCKCEKCNKKYIQRYSRDKEICYPCRKKEQMLDNTFGKANKGKPGLSGSLHPRWNPNKVDFIAYSRKVHWLTKKTYDQYKNVINPNDLPRTLCGIDGGYQLDHKVSIKEGYLQKMPPEELAKVSNLQILHWQENRNKWHKVT